MRKLIVFLILILSLFTSKADAILIENGATNVTVYFVLRDKTAGTVDTGVTITDLDMWYIEDLKAQYGPSNVTALGTAIIAHDPNKAYHCGNGLYRTDWPDSAFDGGIGKRVQLIISEVGGDAFTEIMEVELSAPVDAVLVGGATPLSAANIEAEAVDALEFFNLDHWMGVALSNTATLPEVADNSALAILLTKTDGTSADYDFTTDSHEALAAGAGGDITAIMGTALTQDTGGNLADNFSEFWNDGDSQASTAKYSNIADILTDTEAQDETSEIRTLMTGADTPVAKDSTPLTAGEVEAEAIDAIESFGLENLILLDTTIASYSSNTSFTLSAGSGDDDAYNGCTLIIEDQSTATQKAIGLVIDYSQAAKTITLAKDPLSAFTFANGDKITIVAGTTSALVWDRVLTGTTHNIATSAGKRLRQVEHVAHMYDGGVASATASTLVADSGPVATDGYYDDTSIIIVTGTGAGQSRHVTTYTQSDLTFNIAPNWITNPASDSEFAIRADSEVDVHQLSSTALAQNIGINWADIDNKTATVALTGTTVTATVAGLVQQATTIAAYASNTSFTLTAGSPDDDAYVGSVILIVDQSDSTQTATGVISAYTTSANTITLESDPLAGFTFANGDTIYILALETGSGASAASIADAVRDEPITSSETFGTIGWYLYKIRQALGLIR